MAAPLTSILKTTSTAGPTASVEVGDENPEKNGPGVQVEDQGKKESAYKSCKGQKTAKSKKWIRAKKVEASKARNFSSQLGVFLIIDARKAFIEFETSVY